MPKCTDQKSYHRGQKSWSALFLVIQHTQKYVIFKPFMHRHIPICKSIFYCIRCIKFNHIDTFYAIKLKLSIWWPIVSQTWSNRSSFHKTKSNHVCTLQQTHPPIRKPTLFKKSIFHKLGPKKWPLTKPSWQKYSISYQS